MGLILGSADSTVNAARAPRSDETPAETKIAVHPKRPYDSEQLSIPTSDCTPMIERLVSHVTSSL